MAQCRACNDPDRELTYFKALEEVEETIDKYTLEKKQRIKGYWLLDYQGKKLSFYKDLRRLILHISDSWGYWVDFKILS